MVNPNPKIEQLLQSAVRHHQAGRLQQAEAIYRELLRQNPTNADALQLLGVIAHQVGRLDVALDLIRQAISLRPDSAEAHNNLGNVLKDKAQLDDAIAAYRRAITLDGNKPEVYRNLGVALTGIGEWDEAISMYRRAIALRPGYPQAHGDLGVALHAQGRVDEAIAACRRAIALQGDYPQAYVNLGNALRGAGQLDEAIASYRQAIALKADYPEAYNNLGDALKDKRQLDEAIAACRQAIALHPEFPEAYNNLGNAMYERRRLDEAFGAYRQALALRPNYPEAQSNLGNVLKDSGQIVDAIAAYRRATALKPTFTSAHDNLVYALHFDPAYDARTIAEELRNWNRQHAQPLRNFIQAHSNDRDGDRRMRIGYVSPDFREHPVGRFLLPLFAHHDKSQVEIFAYANQYSSDVTTDRLRSHTEAWRNIVGLSDAAAADLIRQDRIDILVDLTMHGANNRLLVFARKPAPVQVTYLAYCSSTGLETIDYRLTDPYLDPPGTDELAHSERTIRLPETYWCYQPSDGAPEVGPLPALSRGKITFGSLNHFAKVSEPVLAAWAQLLRGCPNSELLLHCFEGRHRQRVCERLGREGIDSARVRFVEQIPMLDYLRLYSQIDIGLDTFPYGGGTTTCDALYMGVPVVSLMGQTGVGRGGMSILSNVGLGELVARSEEAYLRIASDLANDLPRLGILRSTLRGRMEQSPVMDASHFARNIEEAYRYMWRAWCAGTGQ